MMDYVQPLIGKRVRSPGGVEWITYISLEKYRERNCLPNHICYIFLFSLVLFMWLFGKMDNSVPTQATFKDEYVKPERFIAERAVMFLKRLTDIGPKVVGSYENEVLAVDLLKREISFISQQTKNIHKIEVDVQKATGSYYLTLKPNTFRNYYENVQNVIVKFSSVNSSSDSLLLNCHFDTVPESPGASDNGLNCAVLLEILNKLSKYEEPFLNTVIFLFNGAEENPLQASHGFITQHKWRKDIKAVINLDSAGAGGREVLFQTSANFPWLVKTFASVARYPAGGVHAEELFLSGIIPSDTDFRIFKEVGEIPGLDFAHIRNGYVYHTKFDTMDFINPGVIQHTGDNILALVKEVALSPEFGQHVKENEDNDEWKAVYFDVFGLFMVVYTEPTAYLLNLGTAAFSFLTLYRSITFLPGSIRSVKKVMYAAKQLLTGWLLAAGLVSISGKAVDLFDASMSWYNRPWLIIPLYFTMFIFGTSALPITTLGRLRGVKAEKKAILFTMATQLIWTTILILGTILGIRSSFVIMLLVMSSAFSAAITTISRRSFLARTYVAANVFCTMFPVLFIIHQTSRLFSTLIPMTARMGPQSQPELIICSLVVIMGVLITSFLVPVVLIMRRPRQFMILSIIFHMLTVIAVIGTSIGFPYAADNSSPAPQRFYVLHTERTFYDLDGNIRKSDSGFFVQSLDRNGLNYAMESFPELMIARSASTECPIELNCGAPVFTPRYLNIAPTGYWIDTYPPIIHHKTDLVVSSETLLSDRAKRINFVATGPDHMTILISPKPGVHLYGWTFDNDKPKSATQWLNRLVYMIYYSHGIAGGNLEFGLDIEANNNLTEVESVLDVVVIGHYLNNKERTEEFLAFLDHFPDWAHLTPWTASFKSWTF